MARSRSACTGSASWAPGVFNLVRRPEMSLAGIAALMRGAVELDVAAPSMSIGEHQALASNLGRAKQLQRILLPVGNDLQAEPSGARSMAPTTIVWPPRN